MADEGESKNQLTQPGLGDRQPEEEVRWVVGGRGEGVVEAVVGVVELPVDKGATDLMLGGKRGDRLPCQGVEGELLACLGGQQASGCSSGEGRDSDRGTG